MSTKEKPLIDAMSKWGGLPDFVFASSATAGFATILLCAIFGALAFTVQVYGRGFSDHVGLFLAARWGAIVFVGLAYLFLFIFCAVGLFAREEPIERLHFAGGGLAAGGLLALANHLASDYIINNLESSISLH